jgi:uncharacterized protein YkuJ
MTHVLSLGAINKKTREYIYPKIANKKDEYVCPDCNKDLILCQGEIIRPYFRHKVDSVNPCNHYSNPTETQIHKDGKMVIKSLLERKTPISFVRNCCSCKKNEEYKIPEMTESSKIELEYRFEYNGTKIADVAYIDNDDILCIFEICNTHKTCSENRPEPWFEIDAETLIKLANDNSTSHIKISCIRCEKCEKCLIDNADKEIQSIIQNIFENIQKNKYKFTTEQFSIFAPNFPDSTKMIACETDKNDISIFSDIIVDCENNFTRDEKEVIDKFNINNIEDLIRNNKIDKIDKQRCLKCFAYVRERYELMGTEPPNGHNVIQLEKLAISIRILPNGIIKYCKSLGEINVRDFTIIGLA